jgi:hypothetical protein
VRGLIVQLDIRALDRVFQRRFDEQLADVVDRRVG